MRLGLDLRKHSLNRTDGYTGQTLIAHYCSCVCACFNVCVFRSVRVFERTERYFCACVSVFSGLSCSSREHQQTFFNGFIIFLFLLHRTLYRVNRLDFFYLTLPTCLFPFFLFFPFFAASQRVEDLHCLVMSLSCPVGSTLL